MKCKSNSLSDQEKFMTIETQYISKHDVKYTYIDCQIQKVKKKQERQNFNDYT